MESRTVKRQYGFSLIELLSVISILGVLSAVALPQYSSYQARSYDRQAQSALRAIATAQEIHYLDYGSYISCDESSCPVLLVGIRKLAQGVKISVTSLADSYTAVASHNSGTGAEFTWEG